MAWAELDLRWATGQAKNSGGSVAARVSTLRDVPQRLRPELCEPEAPDGLAPPPE